LNPLKKSHGGARPGAGRKAGGKNAETISKELAREALRQIVLAEMQALTAAQIAHAKGLSYLVARDKTGKFKKLTSDEAEKALAGDSDYTLVEVWEKDPSVQAYTDLMNRALDKPKEQEQEVAHTGTLVIRHEAL
jgi:hypothetical protein